MAQIASQQALEPLEVFVREWTMSPSPDAGVDLRARTTFEWLRSREDASSCSDGRSSIPRSRMASPSSASTPRGRGTSSTTSTRGVWRLWRMEPGFSQRFAGTFSDDRDTIVGRWESSSDGSSWSTTSSSPTRECARPVMPPT